jgi:hypothetical protein
MLGDELHPTFGVSSLCVAPVGRLSGRSFFDTAIWSLPENRVGQGGASTGWCVKVYGAI